MGEGLPQLVVVFVFLPTLLLLAAWTYNKTRRRRPILWGGYVHPAFEKVKDVFLDNLMRSWERDGAALCIYYKGECIADLWGGMADRDSLREYQQNTLQIVFSTSKALGAVCIAKLVDDKKLRYTDKVASFWPAFGQNGKQDITVDMVLGHTAGLAHLDQLITREDALDHRRMADILERQRPNWLPGDAIGYHALSYGWLVDQIIRHVDGRGVGQFFKEEIAQVHGLEIHIGLPLDQAWRVARITRPSVWNRVDEFLTDPDNVNYLFMLRQYLTKGMSHKVAHNPPWLQTIFNCYVNNPDVYPLEQTALLAISSAREMARFAHLLQSGKIVSKPTLETMEEIISSGKDVISGTNTSRGRGVTAVEYKKNDLCVKMIGHAGLGGQNLRWDRNNEIAYCYLSNGLKGGLGDRARSYVRVVDAFFESLSNGNNNEILVKPLFS